MADRIARQYDFGAAAYLQGCEVVIDPEEEWEELDLNRRAQKCPTIPCPV